jgi:hypothetical protein
MNNLFPVAETHYPGGKVRLRLAPGITGAAEFYGENNEYRLWLSRFWGDERGPYGLSIGMNPSTATAEIDDSTLKRDTHFMRREQLSGFYKANVMDYRATKPATLLKPGVLPCSDRNLSTILDLAQGASLIMLCYGVLIPKLRPYAERVVSALHGAGHTLHCLGTSSEGFPLHSLYLRGDTPLQAYDRAA